MLSPQGRSLLCYGNDRKTLSAYSNDSVYHFPAGNVLLFSHIQKYKNYIFVTEAK